MVLKWGSTRTVLLIGRWAIKTPSLVEWRLFLHGLLANITERTWSRTGDTRLARVLWGDPIGLLLIMERADPLPKNFSPKHFADIVHRGRFDGLPQDIKMDNFGFRSRTMVMIDYGS